MVKTSVRMKDCNYNCVKQLAKISQFLWNIDGYIKDAKKNKHSQCVKIFEQMKKDNTKHAKLLKEAVAYKCAAKKF